MLLKGKFATKDHTSECGEETYAIEPTYRSVLYKLHTYLYTGMSKTTGPAKFNQILSILKISPDPQFFSLKPTSDVHQPHSADAAIQVPHVFCSMQGLLDFWPPKGKINSIFNIF